MIGIQGIRYTSSTQDSSYITTRILVSKYKQDVN